MAIDRVGEAGPALGRHEEGYTRLYCLGVLPVVEAQAQADAEHVGVHYDSRLAETGRQDEVRGLTAHAWQHEELVHAAGNLAPEAFYDDARAFDEVPRFGPEKADAVDRCFNLGGIGPGESGHVRPSREEAGCDAVHLLVGTLRR